MCACSRQHEKGCLRRAPCSLPRVQYSQFGVIVTQLQTPPECHLPHTRVDSDVGVEGLATFWSSPCGCVCSAPTREWLRALPHHTDAPGCTSALPCLGALVPFPNLFCQHRRCVCISILPRCPGTGCAGQVGGVAANCSGHHVAPTCMCSHTDGTRNCGAIVFVFHF